MSPSVLFKGAGRALLAWRGQVGMSTTKLAAELGVSPQAFGAWERGVKRPQLAEALVIDHRSGGVVPFTAWHYPPALRAVMAALCARADALAEAG